MQIEFGKLNHFIRNYVLSLYYEKVFLQSNKKEILRNVAINLSINQWCCIFSSLRFFVCLFVFLLVLQFEIVNEGNDF